MPDISEQRIPARSLSSLAWDGDTLVDPVGGFARFSLDGGVVSRSVVYAYDFDAVATAPGTDFSVIYTRFGTKGLLLRGQKPVRELNRSFYHANVYEYPICLFVRDAQTFLIHCPNEYNELEIEEAATGKRLTARASSSADFFHSRFAVNPAGTHFLSAGWVWHPWDVVVYFDIDEALRDPAHLDSIDWCAPVSTHVGLTEESSACWQTNTRVIVGGGDETDDTEQGPRIGSDLRLYPRGLAVYDIAQRAIESSVVLEQPTGRLMPVGETHAVTFYDYPRLIRLSDGVVEHQWPSLSTGKQTSSIYRGTPLPPVALDPSNSRFAVADEDSIHVVRINSI